MSRCTVLIPPLLLVLARRTTFVREIPYVKRHGDEKFERHFASSTDRVETTIVFVCERHADALPNHVSDESAFTRLTIVVYEICCKNKSAVSPKTQYRAQIAEDPLFTLTRTASDSAT